MIALLAPGQGSQTEGMLSPWLQLPGAADQIAAWSKAADLDLARLGTTASTEEITDTAVAQPLIVAATLLAHQELARRCVLAGKDVIVAGHSVGEIAAYAIAGVIAADDAVALAATRGAEMAKACATEPTGMSAVLGGDETEVLSRLEQLDLVPANRNAAGQIVAAGRLTALEKLAEDPPAKARVRALGVAGAFHTEFMAPALDGFAAAAANIATADPTATLLSNRDGKPVTSAAAAMDTLVSQLTQPVRWDLCTATLREHTVTAIVEFPPAGTLSGIAKRELRGVPARAVKSPADLDELANLYPRTRPEQPHTRQFDLYTTYYEGKHAVPVTQEEIIAGIAEIIEEVTGIEPSEITPEKSFVDDLDIDSLSMVEIAVQTEDKYGVKIPDEDLAGLRTVGDVVAYIQKLEEENPEAAQALRAKIESENPDAVANVQARLEAESK